MRAKKLTKKQIESLAKDIRQFLLDREMWQDVAIYFNGKAYSTDDRAGHYYYNDPGHLVELEGEDPARYVEWTGDVLTMTFEGPLYELLNYGEPSWKWEDDFRKVFQKHGCWFELGHAWSLAAYAL